MGGPDSATFQDLYGTSGGMIWSLSQAPQERRRTDAVKHTIQQELHGVIAFVAVIWGVFILDCLLPFDINTRPANEDCAERQRGKTR